MSPKKNVLFLVPYPQHRAPSQRFRVELFLPLFPHHNMDYQVQPFLDEATFSQLYQKGGAGKKVLGVLKGFAKRFYTVLFRLRYFDYVFIHREAAPVGPPVLEWFIAKVFRKKIIYDFDDAIWISDSSNRLLNSLRTYGKVKKICTWAYKVVGGNTYLCQYASQYNQQVVLLPTCVDVVAKHNTLKKQDTDIIVIGWTGSHSTLKYLDDILPVLKKVATQTNTELLIICNKPPNFQLPNLHFLRWREESEVEDLLKINIGIMPLQQDKWSEGKCGFKLIQYLALGIPAVGSPVGVNSRIIEEGKNGFLCRSLAEWEEALTYLVRDQAVRAAFGRAGRQKIEEHYSLQANEGVFFSLFS